MSKTRRWLRSAVILGVFVCVPVPNSAQSSDSDSRLTQFIQLLKNDSYSVTPGLAGAFNLADDWCSYVPNVPHAIYTNKAYYIALKVPQSDAYPTHLVSDFQMLPDEAIVLIGTTPPPAKYFGFYTFVAKKVYPDGEKREIRNSAVDPVNNLTIKTAGPTPFNTQVALIFTPDQGTDARVRAALRSAGYPEAIINTVVFPASMLSFGYDEVGAGGAKFDEFNLTIRNAIWLEGQEGAGNSYILKSAENLHIYRVTPKAPCSGPDCNPFPMPPLRVRGTGQTELHLWNKLVELRKGIIDKNRGLYATDIPIIPAIGYEGYDYMQRGEWEGGDARDAFIVEGGYLPEFLSRDRQITLADEEFLMVFGANHVATGKATYTNITVYTGEEKDGKIAVGTVDDSKFAGTATPYLEPGDSAADFMYAYKISRKCGDDEPKCLQVSAPCDRLTLDSSTVLGIIIRPYLEPATKIGAAMPEVLYDRVIKFSPRPPKRK